jgi:glucose-1-phosphate thymidylyltransferase
MKAIILAGGYATRLQPLTDDLSKCLLPVGGKPMVDWILDRVRAAEEVEEVHVVTNSRFARDFEHWAMAKNAVTVHDDGTRSNDDRLGAIGDVAFTLERAGIVDDDVIVIAGDNLFDYDLQGYIDFWRGKGVASAVAVRDVGDLRLASQYGIVELDGDDRVIDFVEKPPAPASTFAAGRALSRRGQCARPVRQLHRMAPLARAGLRLLVRRDLARHRRQGAAARRGQHAPASAWPTRARRVRARDIANRHDCVTHP